MTAAASIDRLGRLHLLAQSLWMQLLLTEEPRKVLAGFWRETLLLPLQIVQRFKQPDDALLRTAMQVLSNASF